MISKEHLSNRTIHSYYNRIRMTAANTANTGIIAHLRSGGFRAPEAPLAIASNGSSISAFLRRRSSAQNTALMPLGMTYKPTPEQLGLKSPFLPAARVTQPNTIAWMDKSFLGYLRKMLHDVEVAGGGNRDAVSWGPSGDNFMIRDNTFFATNIAPRYFSIFSNSTFRLVAQSWGFVVDSDQNGFETYRHPGFLRDDPAKCQNLSMQEMKELAIRTIDTPESTSKTVEDALLLLAATASSHQDATASPQGSEVVVKKTNPKKFGFGAKKSSVIKARRASLNNASPLGSVRRSSLNNAPLLGTAYRSSVTNTLTRGRSNGLCMPQSKTSATVALLKSRRRHSVHNTSPLEHSVIAPFAGMHMSPTSQGNLAVPTSPQAAKVTEEERQGLLNDKTAMSSSFGNCNIVTDHLRNRMR